jgi:hypothetical protein
MSEPVKTRLGPIPLRRSTHMYCPGCNVSAENYGDKNCTKCLEKNVKWSYNINFLTPHTI